MIRKNPSGHLPVIDESAYIDKTAIICGKVIIKENVFVGPYAVIRQTKWTRAATPEPIVIGANSNIQGWRRHPLQSGAAVTIGEYSSIAHRSIVHGRVKWATGSSSASTACCSTATSAKDPWCATTRGRWLRYSPASMSSTTRINQQSDLGRSRASPWTPPSSPRMWPTPISTWSGLQGAPTSLIRRAVRKIPRRHGARGHNRKGAKRV